MYVVHMQKGETVHPAFERWQHPNQVTLASVSKIISWSEPKHGNNTGAWQANLSLTLLSPFECNIFLGQSMNWRSYPGKALEGISNNRMSNLNIV